MKKIITIVIFIFLLATLTSATSYFKFKVNGAEAIQLIQGDVLSWEYDVSVSGGSAIVGFYLDLDADQAVSDGDQLLIEFGQTDGNTNPDGPPPDSSATPDGLIVSDFGIFGFAPADYLFYITDQNDESHITGALRVDPLLNPPNWCIGKVSMEGVTPPDPQLQNIMIEADDENYGAGVWSALTDENGDYSINLPAGAINTYWEIGIGFPEMYSEYNLVPGNYEHVAMNPGENGPYNFTIEIPKSFVYGTVYDELYNKLPIRDYGSLFNLNYNEGNDFQIIDGVYKVGAVFEGSDTVDVPFSLQVWGMGFLPDYLAPPTWGNNYSVTLSKGDSVEKNIYVVATDAVIYVQVTMDGGKPDRSYRVRASNDTLGHSWVETDVDGNGTIPVRSGHLYNVNFETEEDGQFVLPPGYVVEGNTWQQGVAGQHLIYNLVKSDGSLSGKYYFSAGDSAAFNPQNSYFWASEEFVSEGYPGEIKPDSMRYRIYVPNGAYSVYFQNWTQSYLSKPYCYEDIVISNSSVDTLDFELNYCHAKLVVQLKRAPKDCFSRALWMNVTTVGEYPDIFWTNAEIREDTSFVFHVCDGLWDINAPYFGPDYTTEDQYTSVQVSNDTAFYYVEIKYNHVVAIRETIPVPDHFYVKKNYPNPFNPQTVIEFGLPQRMPVKVDIYDMSGRLVERILEAELAAGQHRIKWNAAIYSSGIYICRVSVPGITQTTRMLLIK